MSSSLFRVKVLSVKDNEAVFGLSILDPEEEYLPTEANFAAQLVIEAWDMAIHHDFDPDSLPVSADEAEARARKSPFAKQFRRWASYMYGAEQEISYEEYLDIEKNHFEEKHRFPRNMVEWKEENGKYYMILDTDDRAIIEVSDDQILFCNLRNEDTDDDGNPTAEMVFTVDDRDILNHLIIGSSWGTDRYDL